MKFKLIIAVFLLFAASFNLNAKAKKNVEAVDGQVKLTLITVRDSVRNEFDLKKKNTKLLIVGKSPGSVSRYYSFYLQENDHKRADSLLFHMVTSKNDVQYRLKVSLIAYRFTSDTKTRLLFLSDPDSLQAYRISLINYNKDSLKSNDDMRAYYYNLVSLDSAVYQGTQDSIVKRQLSRHYNSLAWLSILTQKLNDVEYYLHQSMKFDPEYKYPFSNLPLLFLLKGRYKEARKLYLKYKDMPLDTPDITYRDGFLEDFTELAKAGINHPDIKKIKKILMSKHR